MNVTLANAAVGLVLGLIALGAAVLAWWRWAQPYVDRWLQRRRDRDVVLLGRPAVPPNLRTGEPAQGEIPPIARQISEIRDLLDATVLEVRRRLDKQDDLLHDVHHEVHRNDGTSLKDAVVRVEARLTAGDELFAVIDGRLERIEGTVAGELSAQNDALANAAEASKVAITTIQDAIRSTPPEPADLD